MSETTMKKVIPNPEFGVLENEFNAYLAEQGKKEAKEKILNIKKAVHLDEDWEDENYFEDEFGKYRASHLWAAAKGLPIKKVNILDVFNPEEWKKEIKESDPKYYQEELKRVEKADLSYPIILTPKGNVCDGFHRLMKAYLAGEKTIDAVQLESMPGEKKPKKINLEIKEVLELFDNILKSAQDKEPEEEEELTHPIEDIEAAALKDSYGPYKQEPDIKKLREELETNPDIEPGKVEEYKSSDESDFEDE